MKHYYCPNEECKQHTNPDENFYIKKAASSPSTITSQCLDINVKPAAPSLAPILFETHFSRKSLISINKSLNYMLPVLR